MLCLFSKPFGHANPLRLAFRMLTTTTHWLTPGGFLWPFFPSWFVDGTDFKGERLTVQFARGPRRKEAPGPPERPSAPRPRRTIYRMQLTGLPETSWQVRSTFPVIGLCGFFFFLQPYAQIVFPIFPFISSGARTVPRRLRISEYKQDIPTSV